MHVARRRPRPRHRPKKAAQFFAVPVARRLPFTRTGSGSKLHSRACLQFSFQGCFWCWWRAWQSGHEEAGSEGEEMAQSTALSSPASPLESRAVPSFGMMRTGLSTLWVILTLGGFIMGFLTGVSDPGAFKSDLLQPV